MAYEPDQPYLLPPDLRDWLPEGDLALFVSDMVDQLDLSAIYQIYEGDGRGRPAYHPAMMVDADEDARFGKGQAGNEWPKGLKRRESRLKKIQEAKAQLKAEARVKTEERNREVEEQRDKRGPRRGGKPSATPDPNEAASDPKAERNFTDPDSRMWWMT